jgi:hypothetical protein
LYDSVLLNTLLENNKAGIGLQQSKSLNFIHENASSSSSFLDRPRLASGEG